jgi:ketosteroid isomerase-like protein
MGDHPNAEALRKGYGAFAVGDMETVASLFADDIAWHSVGQQPNRGRLRG